MQIPWKFPVEYGIMFLLFFTLKLLPRILLTLIISCDFLSFSPLALPSLLNTPLLLLVLHGSMALSTIYMPSSFNHHHQLWDVLCNVLGSEGHSSPGIIPSGTVSVSLPGRCTEPPGMKDPTASSASAASVGATVVFHQ